MASTNFFYGIGAGLSREFFLSYFRGLRCRNFLCGKENQLMTIMFTMFIVQTVFKICLCHIMIRLTCSPQLYRDIGKFVAKYIMDSRQMYNNI